MGKQGKQWQALFFWAPKSLHMVTAAMKLKYTAFKKSYVKPKQRFKKQRHHFANKGPYSHSYGFSSSHVWMWELDHKEAEHQRTDALQLWCWRKLLGVRWTARRSNQSILKEINPEYSPEGLMLKLKFQYLGPLMGEPNSLKLIKHCESTIL